MALKQTITLSQPAAAPKPPKIERVLKPPYVKVGGQRRTRNCKRCGMAFAYVVTTRPPDYCTACVLIRQRELRGLHKKAKTFRQRAIHHGVDYEPVNVRSIYRRDRWHCQLCGERVDPKAKWPDQMCASLDHVVPMAVGGPHKASNVQLAHWLCNVLKGTTDLDFRIVA